MPFVVRRVEIVDGVVFHEAVCSAPFPLRADAEAEAGRQARLEGAPRYDSARGFFLVVRDERTVRFVPGPES